MQKHRKADDLPVGGPHHPLFAGFQVQKRLLFGVLAPGNHQKADDLPLCGQSIRFLWFLHLEATKADDFGFPTRKSSPFRDFCTAKPPMVEPSAFPGFSTRKPPKGGRFGPLTGKKNHPLFGVHAQLSDIRNCLCYLCYALIVPPLPGVTAAFPVLSRTLFVYWR